MEAKPDIDQRVFFELGEPPEVQIAGIDDRIVEVTEETANVLQRAIQAVATNLKPDLRAIGASKATVKIGAKLAMKNGRLTALISEVTGEATVEVTVEFTA